MEFCLKFLIKLSNDSPIATYLYFYKSQDLLYLKDFLKVCDFGIIVDRQNILSR